MRAAKQPTTCIKARSLESKFESKGDISDIRWQDKTTTANTLVEEPPEGSDARKIDVGQLDKVAFFVHLHSSQS